MGESARITITNWKRVIFLGYKLSHCSNCSICLVPRPDQYYRLHILNALSLILKLFTVVSQFDFLRIFCVACDASRMTRIASERTISDVVWCLIRLG